MEHFSFITEPHWLSSCQSDLLIDKNYLQAWFIIALSKMNSDHQLTKGWPP